MIKKLFQISTVLFISITTGCSSSDSSIKEEIEITESSEEQSDNSDSEEEQPTETEESIFFSKIIYENIVDGNLAARVEFQFEENKVVREEGFDAVGMLQNYTTYKYGENGLIQNRTNHNSDGSIRTINNFGYENNKLVSIEIIRNQFSDIIYTNITYSNDLIENELVDSNGNRLMLSKYYLNDDGFIYKSDNGIPAEITLEDGLPISKIVQYPTNTLEFEHVYLDNPMPKGPWKNFWGKFYGSLNNQIVRSGSGVVSHEDTVDLTKYIVSAGSQLQREYEFDVDGLPIRIEKTFSPTFKSIWEIEYQK
ncbi:hypothetical protein BFP77_05380 [Maribacter sp. 4U21]|uniref:hypothetical protein n=1 Tax=Maribacter sp. 4U21 TaxID=1889779 RepID=UPI000C15E49E|nr:hypothetical protein [Maribacter sp. 4U21]PIB29587.1 hypothetical protein BFP77_05380 [Maribacter sp. 4U21]